MGSAPEPSAGAGSKINARWIPVESSSLALEDGSAASAYQFGSDGVVKSGDADDPIRRGSNTPVFVYEIAVRPGRDYSLEGARDAEMLYKLLVDRYTVEFASRNVKPTDTVRAVYGTMLYLYVLSLLACGAVGEQRAASDCSTYGLEESIRFRSEVEWGIALADHALSRSVSIRFQSTWPPALGSPTVTFQHGNSHRVNTDEWGNYSFTGYAPVPVRLLEDGVLADSESSFVPQGERCVLMNTRALEHVFDAFGLGVNAVQQYSKYERALAVAIVLLHEAGHLSNGDAGSYLPARSVDLTDLNPQLTGSANREIEADAFSAAQINILDAAAEYFDSRSLGPRNAQVAGGLRRVVEIAFSTYDYRRDPFGFLGPSDRTAFLKHSYSHPDLALRFVVMRYKLNPTAANREDLVHVLERQPPDLRSGLTPQ
jgi:hypothetical protein